MNILLASSAGLMIAGGILAVTQTPSETRPDIFSFLIKMALTGLFYVLFRIFTFGIGKTESKAVGEAATTAGSQLQSV